MATANKLARLSQKKGAKQPAADTVMKDQEKPSFNSMVKPLGSSQWGQQHPQSPPIFNQSFTFGHQYKQHPSKVASCFDQISQQQQQQSKPSTAPNSEEKVGQEAVVDTSIASNPGAGT